MIRILSIRNRQQVRSVDTALLRRITRTLLKEDLDIQTYELAVHLLTADEMSTLNETFLQHQGSTDVITFDHVEPAHSVTGSPRQSPRHLHGEIFLSVPDAVRQAGQFKTTWQNELVRYVIHGLLHLIGHDDLAPATRKMMKRVENQLVKRMTAVFPVSKLGRPAKRKVSPTRKR
jgi:probable rRNA maturation factor